MPKRGGALWESYVSLPQLCSMPCTLVGWPSLTQKGWCPVGKEIELWLIGSRREVNIHFSTSVYYEIIRIMIKSSFWDVFSNLQTVAEDWKSQQWLERLVESRNRLEVSTQIHSGVKLFLPLFGYLFCLQMGNGQVYWPICSWNLPCQVITNSLWLNTLNLIFSNFLAEIWRGSALMEHLHLPSKI